MSLSTNFTPLALPKKLKRTLLAQAPEKGSLVPALVMWAICLALSVVYWNDYGGLSDSLAASHRQIFEQHEWWRLFTAPAVHGDLEHFLSNSAWFLVLGYLLRGYFGGWAFPILAWIGGVATHAVVLDHSPDDQVLVGASGVIHYMAAFWAMMFIFVERKLPLGRRILVSAGWIAATLLPGEYRPQVSYAAHSVGLGLGVLTAPAYYWANRVWIRSRDQWEIPVIEPDLDKPAIEAEWHTTTTEAPVFSDAQSVELYYYDDLYKDQA